MVYVEKFVLMFIILLMLTEKFPQQMELFHSLKKAFHQVSSASSFGNVQFFHFPSFTYIASETGHTGL